MVRARWVRGVPSCHDGPGRSPGKRSPGSGWHSRSRDLAGQHLEPGGLGLFRWRSGCSWWQHDVCRASCSAGGVRPHSVRLSSGEPARGRAGGHGRPRELRPQQGSYPTVACEKEHPPPRGARLQSQGLCSSRGLGLGKGVLSSVEPPLARKGSFAQ